MLGVTGFLARKIELIKSIFHEVHYAIIIRSRQAVINIFVLENLFGGRSRRRRSGESFKLE